MTDLDGLKALATKKEDSAPWKRWATVILAVATLITAACTGFSQVLKSLAEAQSKDSEIVATVNSLVDKTKSMDMRLVIYEKLTMKFIGLNNTAMLDYPCQYAQVSPEQVDFDIIVDGDFAITEDMVLSGDFTPPPKVIDYDYKDEPVCPPEVQEIQNLMIQLRDLRAKERPLRKVKAQWGTDEEHGDD